MSKDIKISNVNSEVLRKLNDMASKVGIPTTTYIKTILFNHTQERTKVENPK